MSAQEGVIEITEYRLVLVLPESRKILTISDADGYHLPSVSIPQWTRPAKQLQDAIRNVWKLNVIILDFLRGFPFCALAEVVAASQGTDLKTVSLEQLPINELSEQQLAQVAATIAADSCGCSPFCRIGWTDEAIAWLESETAKTLSSKRDIEQYNAGGSFALIRFRMADGWDYWMKATGHPNEHEPSITALLSKLCGGYLPEFISSKPSWNAWLMPGEAKQIPEIPGEPSALLELLKDAVESMAKLQMQCI
jgi:hypothetical protein